MNEPQLLKPGESITIVLTDGEVLDILKNIYGIIPQSIVELNGYDDKNYKITVKCPNTAKVDEYVLKFLNTLDSKNTSLMEGQSSMLLFLNSSGVTCPKPIKNVNGEYFSIENFVSGQHCVRLLEYIPGSILKDVHPSPSLFYQIGKFVAELDRLLKNFYHPVYETHKSLWMLESIPSVKKFLFAIKDEAKREIINTIFEKFENRVLSISHNLERGMIHGDINEHNIIVQYNNDKWELKGVIDFGDCQNSCYLYELAITITYMIIVSRDLNVAGYVLAGYNTVRKITDDEYSLLKICIMSRLGQSYAIGIYSHLRDPKNTYVLSSLKHGWEMLMKLNGESEKETLNKWKLTLNNYNHFING